MRTVLVVLAVFRLTRLVTRDYLLARPRRWLQARLPEPVAYLLGCPWCVSMYIGVGVAGVAVVWPANRAVTVGLLGLAASAVTGLVTVWFDPGEPEELDSEG